MAHLSPTNDLQDPADIGDPGAGFAGRIGKTLAESQPDWREPVRSKPGTPNVLVILLDDLGFSDFGCFGGEIKTPHIDALARDGLRFSGYTTVPMCTPARAAMLTGKNPHSVGCGWLTHNDPGYPGYKGEMSLDAPTMAELLRAGGYATMCAGKWHNTYDHNARVGGDTRSWPVQRGFDRFYGFMAAEASYFHPDRMMEGNQPARDEQYPPDYFAPDDYTSRAIGWLAEQQACAPEQPFFLYLAYQTPHTPHHAKPADMARYRGRYDMGWDVIRQQRFERQQAMGLIEPQAKLPARNPGVPAWDSLNDAQRALYARYMEVYAALVDNCDQNIGRVIAHLRASGQLENTLILLTSDNGANSVGGPQGLMNLQGMRQGRAEAPELLAQLLGEEKVGGPETYPSYPSGWAQVSNTPYRLYKRTPMAGGIRVPLVAHWPAGIADAGAIRRQWVHVTDLLPTVLEKCEVQRPQVFNGYRTRPMDGISFAGMLGDPSAPQQRQRQYYELQGNRGYISGRHKIVSLQVPRTPIALDNWMLFDLEADPTELVDLAAEKPELLQRLIQEFEQEADANYVYPLDNRDELRAVTLPPYELARTSIARQFLRGGSSIPGTVVSPLVADRDFELTIRFDWQCGQEGVLLTMGDRFAGLLLFVEDGAAHLIYQWWFSPMRLAPIALTAGQQELVLDYRALGQRRGQGRVSLNGVPQTDAPVELSPTLVRLPSGGLNVGCSRRLAVNECIEARGTYAYTGRIERVCITPGAQAPDTPILMDEAAVQARMRAFAVQAAAPAA